MNDFLNLKPYVRSEFEQDKHNRIISIIARNLNSTAYSVMADHIGWDLGKPLEANGYIPDIYGTKSTDSMIFEVETIDSFSSKYALKQLQLLLAISKELNAVPFLILPITLGLNMHMEKVKLFLINNKLKEIRLGGCDIRSSKLNIF